MFFVNCNLRSANCNFCFWIFFGSGGYHHLLLYSVIVFAPRLLFFVHSPESDSVVNFITMKSLPVDLLRPSSFFPEPALEVTARNRCIYTIIIKKLAEIPGVGKRDIAILIKVQCLGIKLAPAQLLRS